MSHVHETYHEGGFKKRHPSKNLAEQRDDEKRVVRTWDEDGRLEEERPYTEEEVEAIAEPVEPPPDLPARLAELEKRLAEIERR